ncbi:MAG: NAD(P)/FAD-dependent oxidoreductase [Archaeoglobaceae archaeon]|nr:NAD(P)/FAD-dependent oxidoreductase [Archaeoglobaceae archaeon]MDW8118334.1 NAD(P)/FAD-dependent oxidoreductase [Archaeoglobaceae archaeon]
MKIAVIGAGLTGLRVANELKEDAKIKVFEKDQIGGLLSSFCNSYCIEKFYHHLFKSDFELLDLIKKLGLSSKLVWKTVKVGFAVNDRLYSLSTPFEILKYPHMSLMDKFRLAVFTIKSKRLNYEDFDDLSVISALKDRFSDKLLDNFFLPMLKAKFGDNVDKVSYAWLLARVAIRSNRKLKGEEIGYLRHGFHQLVDKMAENVEIVYEGGKIKLDGKWNVNGEDFDAVVFTAPLPELGEFAKNFRLPEISYQSSVCALLSLKKSISDIYWINVDKATFGAIIEHTNFMPIEDYGENLVYLASYSTPDGWLFNQNDLEIQKLFLKDLKRFGVEDKDVNWIKIFKAKYSSPIYERGFIKKITPYRVHKGFYIAGMTSKPNYPERSMNGSLKAGREVAEQIKKDFGFENS